MTWGYFILQSLFLFFRGTPHLLTSFIPDPAAIYGVPVSLDLWHLINPSWMWIYAAPALLFVVNLILVWRWKHLERPSTTTGSVIIPHASL